MRRALKRQEFGDWGNCVATVRTGAAAVPVILLRRSCANVASQSSTKYSVLVVLSSVVAGAIVKPHASSVSGVALVRQVAAKSAWKSGTVIETGPVYKRALSIA